MTRKDADTTTKNTPATVAIETASGAYLTLNNAHGASGPVPYSRYLAVDRDVGPTSTWLSVPANNTFGGEGLRQFIAVDRTGVLGDDKMGTVTRGGDWCLDLVADTDREVWAGPLAGKKWALALLNRHPTESANITATWTMLNVSADASFSIRDIWANKDAGMHTGSYTAAVGPQAVAYLVLDPV